jgi:hypothetical protein
VSNDPFEEHVVTDIVEGEERDIVLEKRFRWSYRLFNPQRMLRVRVQSGTGLLRSCRAALHPLAVVVHV